jgi:outer membrane protein
MMVRSTMTAIFAAGFLAFAPLGAAQAQMKIGVVNFGALADQSPQAKAVGSTLEREFGERQRVLIQQEKDLKGKAEKFQRDSAVMAEAERNKAQKEILDGQRDLQRRANELKEDLDLRRNEESQKLNRVLIAEVQTYAKANNFDMVLTSDYVIFAKEAINITPAVVAAIQAKMMPAPAAPAK